MKNTNPARFSMVSDAAGVTTKTCDVVYASLDVRMPTQVNTLMSLLGQRVHPTLNAVVAQAALVNQIPQAYIRSQIADAAATAADLLRQNALINAIDDAVEIRCQKINDPNCMMMATGRANAVAAQNAAWINGAKISEQSLPIVRNAAEALMYAIFPIIVLLLLLGSGKTTIAVFSGYAAAMISIQLWPPLFAVLNYMASIYSQFDQAAAASVGGGIRSLSLNTASQIYGNAISAQAVVSYLIIGIPLLSWALSNRLVNFGSTLTGSLTGLQSTIGNSSAAAAAGNVGMGNVTMDQRMVSPMSSSPFVSRVQDMLGNWRTHDGAGRTAISFLRNEGVAGVQVTSRVTQADVDSANKAVSAAASDAISAGSAKSAVLTEIFNRSQSAGNKSQRGLSETISASEGTSKAFEQFGSEVRRIGDALKINDGQVASTLLRFGMMPGAFGVGGGAGLSKNFMSGISKDEQRILEMATSDTFKSAKTYADQVSRDRTLLNAISSESQMGKSIVSSLATSSTRVEAAERKFQEAVTRAQEFRWAHEMGVEAKYDVTSDPVNIERLIATQEGVRRYGNNVQAIAAYLSSSLGNNSFVPSVFSNGSAVPQSFGDVNRLHHMQEQDSAVNPSLGLIRSRNDGSVSRRGLGQGDRLVQPVGADGTSMQSSPAANSPGGSNFRVNIDDKGSLIDSANTLHREFESVHGVRTDPNGRNVRSERSMVGQTVSNAGGDIAGTPGSILDSASEVAGEVYEEQKARLKRQIQEAKDIISGKGDKK
jgi:conjugal transfer mating pair stabilization protein TraG